MKKYLFIVLLVGLVLGQNSNPCEDERFLKIKEKSLEDMTDREYEFFMKKDKECNDYNANKGQTASNETQIDYTDFLISLGCQYDDNGVLNYYNIDSKVWIKIDNQLSFLESLGYREGSTVNGIKGEIYKYKSGRWVKQKLNRNNPITVKSKNKSLPIQSTAQEVNQISSIKNSSPFSLYIRVGNDYFGNFAASGITSLDYDINFVSEDENVETGTTLGAELIFIKTSWVNFGAGYEIQLERELSKSGGAFGFNSQYVIIESSLSGDGGGIMQFGRFGKANFHGNSEFTSNGFFELSGNFYGGLGTRWKSQNYFFEFSNNWMFGEFDYDYGSLWGSFSCEYTTYNISAGLYLE